MTESIPDQYSVDFLFNDEWQVLGSFSDEGDALEYLNKECEKRFTTEPRMVMSANFDYRIRDVNEVMLEIKFRYTPHYKRVH